jgi:class 3 adenylate cyclase
VTILFADIVNFTAFSNNVQPNEVFALLREVFTEFDKLCLKQKVYKLYTIGDCYVAISITEKENRNIYEEAKNVVLFAFSMLEVITAVREKNEAYQNFNMRIGIHTVFQKIKKNLNI